MCSVWLEISISSNSCQYSFVIASVGFNTSIDHITIQHTPTCVENCFHSKVLYNCRSTFYQMSCTLGYNSENSVFSQRWTNYFAMNRCLSCAITITIYTINRDALILFKQKKMS